MKDSRRKIINALIDRIPWLDDEGLIDISVNYLNCNQKIRSIIIATLIDRIPLLDDKSLIDISVNYLNCNHCPTREICSEKHKYSNANEEICKKNLTDYLEK